MARIGPKINIGFHGYGPHHMLAALEHDIVSSIVTVEPRVVIYQALAVHVRRSAGLTEWDENGPRYILKDNGELTYEGSFNEPIAPSDRISSWIRSKVKESSIWKRFLKRERNVQQEDVDLFLAIVTNTRDLVKILWPEAEFYVLFWRDKTWVSERIESDLREHDMNVHLITDVLPDIDINSRKYYLPGDLHPNSYANKLIAEYIVNEIL